MLSRVLFCEVDWEKWKDWDGGTNLSGPGKNKGAAGSSHTVQLGIGYKGLHVGL